MALEARSEWQVRGGLHAHTDTNRRSVYPTRPLAGKLFEGRGRKQQPFIESGIPRHRRMRVHVAETAMTKRHLLKYESKRQPLLSREAFAQRLARNLLAASLLIGLSLLAGMLGYHYFEGMEWIDAFANASMILSGMGPLGTLQTWSGKLFAGLYALYSGLLMIVATGIVFAPVVHRLLHRFHLEAQERE